VGREIGFLIFIVSHVAIAMSFIFFVLILVVCLISFLQSGEAFFPWRAMCFLSLKLGGCIGSICGIGFWFMYRTNMPR